MRKTTEAPLEESPAQKDHAMETQKPPRKERAPEDTCTEAGSVLTSPCERFSQTTNASDILSTVSTAPPQPGSSCWAESPGWPRGRNNPETIQCPAWQRNTNRQQEPQVVATPGCSREVFVAGLRTSGMRRPWVNLPRCLGDTVSHNQGVGSSSGRGLERGER